MTDDEKPCEKCQIPGAPAHDPMPRCQYATYGYVVTHCTCSACWG